MSIVAQSKKRCARCNRILTDPRSIKRGYGPECFGKIALEILVTEHAREAEDPGFLCGHCEQVTPAECFHQGKCPMCFYGITRLEDLDAVPFAEVP